MQIFGHLAKPNVMPTHKVMLDKRRQRKDGTFPLIVRIFNGRKFKDINLKSPLINSQFDEVNQKVNSKHPNYKLLNQKIKQIMLEVQTETLNIEIKQEAVTASVIKERIINPTPRIDFIAYTQQIIAQMKAVGRVGNALAYERAINALKTYSGKQSLQFHEVNFELLTTFEQKMLMGGLKKNSIASYNRSLRAVYNRAINENLVDSKYYPYRRYKIKGEKTSKRNISKSDITAIANLDLPRNSSQWHARNYFMLSFNLRGISFADMASIKQTDIVNGRLTYRRKKTHKYYDVKLTGKALEIIGYYLCHENIYVLPVLSNEIAVDIVKQREVIIQAIKVCNKHLGRIGEAINSPKQLTTYVARYSWANIAKELGYSKDMIAEALGHEFGNPVTGIYLDTFDQEVIDRMNEKVCEIC